MAASLALHHHGKSRVRVGRTWREGNVHHFVEWTVEVLIESDMEHAFLHGSNTDMTPTDTVKNTCYYIAKKATKRCSVEEYAITLGKHFCTTYPKVFNAKVNVREKNWQRVEVDGKLHDHGYILSGPEIHMTKAVVEKNGKGELEVDLVSGIEDMSVLKTTQSGYEGYLKDQFTSLPETNDRMMATTVTANWRYNCTKPECYHKVYRLVKEAFKMAFYGPAQGGVYSPSVQYTLYQMASLALAECKEIDSIYLHMPNLHFLPFSHDKMGVPFENDVYVATSEPHGTIEATVTRETAIPHARL
mmetsp:Transcript_66958/g.212004  ORF Transcript_66958/g.212004 Transcript_66958/m.212004 type:complete len:302 (+) Transcript_66958:81-986(+)